MAFSLDHPSLHYSLMFLKFPNLGSCCGHLYLKGLNLISDPIVVFIQTTVTNSGDFGCGTNLHDRVDGCPHLFYKSGDSLYHDREGSVYRSFVTKIIKASFHTVGGITSLAVYSIALGFPPNDAWVHCSCNDVLEHGKCMVD